LPSYCQCFSISPGPRPALEAATGLVNSDWILVHLYEHL
jgi:hypothetical protein